MLKTGDIVKAAARAHSKKGALNSMWQDFADNFYPARGTFTRTRYKGSEFADHLSTSEPLTFARELSDSIATLLRSGPWFEMTVEGNVSHAAEMWMATATELMRKKMAFPGTGFAKATKNGDRDWAVFGNAALTAQWDLRRWDMNYRCHHLRDMAWHEDASGNVSTVFRKWKPTLAQLYEVYGDKIHQTHKERREKDDQQTVDVIHVEMPLEVYGDESKPYPWMCFYIDTENEHVLEERNMQFKEFVIPRFATESDSQYGYSPATMAAIPDARLMQAMAWTLIEAGERSVKPPLLASRKITRDDVDLFSDGITWVDESYDGRLDDILRPLVQDRGGFSQAFHIQDATRESMLNSFYQAAMSLPIGQDMTAYEVQERIREFNRKATPLFEPVKVEYNGGMCEATFNQMMMAGEFGPIETIPMELSDQAIEFKFRSPLDEAEERGWASIYDDMLDRAKRTMEVDPLAIAEINLKQGLRDSTQGAGAPETWLNTEEQAEEIKQIIMQAQQAAMQQQQEQQQAEQVQ